MLAFLGIVGYFLKIGLGVTGAALGPVGGDTSIGGAPNGVGGGTPPQGAAAGPPPMVQRLLVELRGRIARNPRDAAALAGLASLYIDAGKYAEASGYLQRALAVAPNDPEALFDRGTVANATGHRAEAIASYRAFLRVAPNDERAPEARSALASLGA
jgi:cytochrome c-type biogenesis protein CcmH/NrfG